MNTFRTIFSPLTLFIWVACIALATISGPFGTFAVADWPTRAIYWGVIVTVAIVLGYLVRAVALVLIGEGRPVLFDSVAVGLMTLVCSPLVWLITNYTQMTYNGVAQPLQVFAGYVLICTAAVFVGRRLAPGYESQSYGFFPEHVRASSETDVPVREPRLLRRLSPDLRGDILRLTANDHFVEVFTDKGSETLRLRLTDAIDEMDPIEGYCVHRSHWVTHAAIALVERESAQKQFVVLSNGDRIPVSRKYRSNLVNAGLL